MIAIPIVWFILALLLSFIAGLMVSFWACTDAANSVYKDADEEQERRFTKNANKYLS